MKRPSLRDICLGFIIGVVVAGAACSYAFIKYFDRAKQFSDFAIANELEGSANRLTTRHDGPMTARQTQYNIATSASQNVINVGLIYNKLPPDWKRTVVQSLKRLETSDVYMKTEWPKARVARKRMLAEQASRVHAGGKPSS